MDHIVRAWHLFSVCLLCKTFNIAILKIASNFSSSQCTLFLFGSHIRNQALLDNLCLLPHCYADLDSLTPPWHSVSRTDTLFCVIWWLRINFSLISVELKDKKDLRLKLL